MATTRRTHCANKMPWPAGNHRSLERFLDDAERAGTLDIIADHPQAATVLAFAPHSLDAETVGTVLRFAESQEQGQAFPAAWQHWLQATDGRYEDRAAAAAGFADFAEAVDHDHWEARGDAPVEETLTGFIDVVVAREDGTTPREALDAATGVTTGD
ncbi:hypothetical protein ACFEMC_10705 [Kineococcus sp. DHX-1]|uniref:hypothetical protein n=1 Tax=Kineococcus sp. DHX-1 TaxID=3349638 RepID=UPI0036D24BA5